MVYYIFQIVIFIFIMFYCFKILRQKVYFLILSLINASLLIVYNLIEIIKICIFREDIELFISKLKIIENTEVIICIMLYISLPLLFIYSIILIIKKLGKAKKENILRNKKIVCLLCIALLVVSQIILSKYLNYEINDKFENAIELKNIETYNSEIISVEYFESLFNEIDAENNNEYINESLMYIKNGRNVKISEYNNIAFESVFDSEDFYYRYLHDHKPYIEDEFSQTVRDWLVCYEKGEYELFVMEYYYVEGRFFYKNYTLILYGDTINNQKVVCIHNIVETHALNLSFLEKQRIEKTHQYYYEVLY